MSYKRWLIIATSLFIVGFILGLVVPASMVSLLSEEITALQELTDFLAPLPQPIVFLVIFVTNVSTLLTSFIFSPILCLWPILVLTLNGWLIAFVSVILVQEKSLGFVLAGLLPHGIFELPALILGEAAALSFGTMAILALFKKEKRKLLLPNLKQNSIYLLIALALFLLAAIIETFVTPLLLT
jgi:stage II sporulation protein M